MAGTDEMEGGGAMTLPEEYRAIEAVVLSAVEPVPATLLAELLELPVEKVESACTELAEAYRDEGRGFVLACVAGGYRYQTHPDMAPFVERFALEGVSSRLSSAALESLAIIAYRQPVSRGQIAALRGVNVDGVVRLLEQRGYIAAVGHAPGPGQPVLYGTTPAFLEKLGLATLDQLPPVEDLLPGPDAMEELEERLRPGADA
jgi:segregation and condensation protein B